MQAEQQPSLTSAGVFAEIIIVFGPKTRLARALLAHPAFPKCPLVLISRNAVDTESTQRLFPDATVLCRNQLTHELPAAREVVLYCCAVGPIHPGNIDLAAQADALQDLRAIQTVIHRYEAERVQVVLVSSVLALVHSPSRATYAGWKQFVEGVLAQCLNLCRNSSLSVLYPGRLVEQKRLTEPLSLCYTGYRKLADRMLGVARDSENSRAIIGFDSRLWLCARRALGLLSALTGRG